MDISPLGDIRLHETFNMFWHGDKLSPLEITCIKSFLNYGHKVRVFTYHKVKLPEGVINEDASQILPENQLFIFDNSPSGFSNIFRYKLLLEQGGWWVDTDVLCLHREIPACDYFWAEQAPGEINGAVLKFPVGDPRLKYLLEQSVKRSKYLQVWGQLGPHLLTEVLSEDLPSNHIGKTELVYPIQNNAIHYLWLPEFYEMVEKRCSKAIFLHMWHAMFHRMGIDLECAPPEGSYLRALYEDYGVAMPDQAADEITTRRAIIHYLINNGNIQKIIPEPMETIGVYDKNIIGQNLAIRSLVSVISDQQQRIAALENELANIKPNWIHKQILKIRRAKRKFFPPGSRGAHILGKISNLFKPA